MLDDQDNHPSGAGSASLHTHEIDFLSIPTEHHISTHDLEAHIDELKFFDETRQKSLEMRTGGKAALEDLIEKTYQNFDRTVPISEYQHVKALRVALQTRVKRINQQAWIDAFGYVEDMKRLSATRRSVLVAAECMRGLIATNEFTMCGKVMRCWYWIIRELFTANEPDWAIGGAAAGPEGRVSGFVTAQCVHAIVELSESLRSSHELCRDISETVTTLSLISKPEVPKEWVETEKDRIAQSCKNTLVRVIPRLAFKLTAVESLNSGNLDNYIKENLREQARKSLERAGDELSVLISEVKKFREAEWDAFQKPEQEPGATDAKNLENENSRNRLRKQFDESTTGHSIGLDALKELHDSINNAVGVFNSDGNIWGDVANAFLKMSTAVREGLPAAQGFLSRIIDQQVAASRLYDGRQWEPAELAFAANAYSVMTQRDTVRDDERIRLAAALVRQSLDASGTLVIRRPYYTSPEPTTNYFVPSNAVLAAMADLWRSTKLDLERSLVKRLLPGLVHRCVRNGAKTVGWKTEYSASDAADVLETACAVDALVAINRFLDDGINNVILDHFSVRYPVDDGVGLDRLFYPDYGLAQDVAEEQVKAMVRPSCADFMQRMRAHVTRTGQKPLHSLVLSGPAGTGKTTLVEALAQSCGVPLVEVTPSDLAKGGEAGLERRARTVFEALSLLTHVVILFDEFDPILRRRDASGKKAFTYFSFLTPGMLPKLKNLSEKASKRSVAYVLITNLLGTLDEAAVRRGRFEERLAIFSPDPLARLGRIAVVAHMRARAMADKKVQELEEGAVKTGAKIDVKKEHDAALAEQYPQNFLERLRRVAYETGGLGMPQLTAKGWYRSTEGSVPADSPLAYILGADIEPFENHAEAEDPYDPHLRGTGESARREAAQWWWLNQWDCAVRSGARVEDGDVLVYRLKELGEIVGNEYVSKKHAEKECHEPLDKA